MEPHGKVEAEAQMKCKGNLVRLSISGRTSVARPDLHLSQVPGGMFLLSFVCGPKAFGDSESMNTLQSGLHMTPNLLRLITCYREHDSFESLR